MARATAAGEGQEGSRSVARRGLQYAGELGKLAVGRSEVEPSKRDRRFKDPAWSGNSAFRRLEQGYLATGQATFVVDLAPERSLVEYLVGAGQQVFTISWRNPDERHAD